MTDSGSYNFSAFGERSKELSRLQQQADLFRDLEISNLVRHGLKPNMKVLDVGCGPGFISRTIADAVPQGEVLGFDFNEELLAVAQETLKTSPKSNLRFTRGSIYELGALNETFDLVYCRFVFQHLEHPQKAIAEIFKVLNPKGILVIADVDDGWIFLHPEHPTFEEIIHRQSDYQKSQGGDRYIGRKLHGLFSEAGFPNIRFGIVPVTSGEIGMDKFLELTTGYKIVLQGLEANPLITQQSIEKMIKDCVNGPYFAGVAVFFMSGEK